MHAQREPMKPFNIVNVPEHMRWLILIQYISGDIGAIEDWLIDIKCIGERFKIEII